MSREFGRSWSGYIHTQIQWAAEDCAESGTCELTKLYGKLFEAMYPVIYQLASYEASDSTQSTFIMEAMMQHTTIAKALKDIENYLEPFRAVATQAIVNGIKLEK